MKNQPIKTACSNDFPDDEHMMFETCRRCQELIQNINLKKCAFCCFTSHKHINNLSFTKLIIIRNQKSNHPEAQFNTWISF